MHNKSPIADHYTILKIAITTMMTDVSQGEIYHCTDHCCKIRLNYGGSHVLKKTNFTDFIFYFIVPCGKLVSQEQRCPFLPECAVFPCVQTMVWLPVLGICNVRTDVDACDCSRGLYDCSRGLYDCTRGLYDCSRGLYDCTWGLYDCTRGLYDCTRGLYDCTRGLHDCTRGLHDCTRGLYGHPKESLHWNLTQGEKSLAAPGTRTRVSIAPGFSVGRFINGAVPAPSYLSCTKPGPFRQQGNIS